MNNKIERASEHHEVNRIILFTSEKSRGVRAEKSLEFTAGIDRAAPEAE